MIVSGHFNSKKWYRFTQNRFSMMSVSQLDVSLIISDSIKLLSGEKPCHVHRKEDNK